MPNSLSSPPVRPVPDRLFQAADDDAAHWVFPESDGVEITCRV